MTVAGIDYGVHRVAVTVLPDTGAKAIKVFDLDLRGRPRDPAPDQTDTLWVLYEEVSQFLGAARPTVVVVERPITGSSGNAHTAAQMAMVAGVMVLAASQVGARVVLKATSSWKKDVCGYGSLDKAGVRAWLAEQFPVLAEACTSQDAADAACLALAARQVLEGRDSLLEVD